VNRLRRDLVMNGVVAWPIWSRRIRAVLLRLQGLDVGRAGISPNCFFGGPGISVGDRTFVNYGCFFDGAAEISIGNDCAIGMGAMILTSTHHIGDEARRAGRAKAAPVRIGNGVWLGARAVVLPGTEIQDGCVIAAGAVISGRCEGNGLYRGNPALRMSELSSAAARNGADLGSMPTGS
jgi:maltose O-acetyltransferase